MPILPILDVGDPRLREKVESVDFSAILPSDLGSLVETIVATMRHANGAGLAATQLGLMHRICAMEVTSNPRYPYKPPIPLTIMINPSWVPIGDERFSNFEGCLSVPGIRGRVMRHRRLELTYYNADGERQVEVHTGLRAGTIQHEIDHLDGILFLDRVSDQTSLTTWDNFEAFHREKWLAEIAEIIQEERGSD